jgi:hypothetical protein
LYATLVLPDVLYECKNWPVILGEEHRLKALDNRVLVRYFGPKRGEKKETWENCIMKSFKICVPHQSLFGWSN